MIFELIFSSTLKGVDFNIYECSDGKYITTISDRNSKEYKTFGSFKNAKKYINKQMQLIN